jgi:hypothetical protein
MRIAAAARTGSPERSPGQTLKVVTPAGQAPRRYFQAVWQLNISADPLTAGFVVDPQATRLRGAFLHHDYDVLHPDEPALAAGVGAADGMLRLDLDGPREVLQVLPSGSYSVELYRLDAGKPAPQPTETSPNGNIPPGFTDIAFAALLKPPKSPLAAGDFRSVRVRGYPTGPRLGIADQALKSINFFWRADGEIGKATPASAGNFSAGPALAKALGSYLENAWQAVRQAGAPLPHSLPVALVIQSDAPCELRVDELQVVYHRVLAAGDKQFLRFAGNTVVEQTVTLPLPVQATILSASLRAVESLQPQSFASASGAAPFTQPEIESRHGVRLSADNPEWAAQSFTPDVAVSAEGVALGVMSITGETEIALELRSDDAGAPAAALAAAKVALRTPGMRIWVVGSFSKLIVPARFHWLMLRASKGAALWLTEAGPGAVRLGSWSGSVWSPSRTVDGASALMRLVSPPANGASSGTAQPASWRLSLEGVAINGSSDPDHSLSFDLTAALNSHILSSGSPTEARVTVTSAAKGGVTIYPPRIVYDA